MKQEKVSEVSMQPPAAASVVAKVPAKKRHSPTLQVVNQQQVVSAKDDWELAPKRKAAKLDTKEAK